MEIAAVQPGEPFIRRHSPQALKFFAHYVLAVGRLIQKASKQPAKRLLLIDRQLPKHFILFAQTSTLVRREIHVVAQMTLNLDPPIRRQSVQKTFPLFGAHEPQPLQLIQRRPLFCFGYSSELPRPRPRLLLRARRQGTQSCRQHQRNSHSLNIHDASGTCRSAVGRGSGRIELIEHIDIVQRALHLIHVHFLRVLRLDHCRRSRRHAG